MLKPNLNQGEKLNFFSAFATRAAWVNIFTLQLYKSIFKWEAFPFQPSSILHIVHKEELGEKAKYRREVKWEAFPFQRIAHLPARATLALFGRRGGVIASSFCVSHHHQEL